MDHLEIWFVNDQCKHLESLRGRGSPMQRCREFLLRDFLTFALCAAVAILVILSPREFRISFLSNVVRNLPQHAARDDALLQTAGEPPR